MPAEAALAELYSPRSTENGYGVREMKYPRVYIPVDTLALLKSGKITPEQAVNAVDAILTDLSNGGATSGVTLSQVISLDMIATSAKNGWDRPVYFAMTVPESYYLGLSPYMQSTGLAYKVTPFKTDNGRTGVDADKMYKNITERFRWRSEEHTSELQSRI